MDPQSIREIVGAAVLAPSIHNTQPWRFVAHDEGIDLFADRSRTLSAADPTGRQLHVSCGAALLNARVAARARGIDARVELLPDPGDPDHLAAVALRAGAPPSEEELALAGAITHRHMQRGRFEPAPLAPELVASLRDAASSEGAWLRQVGPGDDQVILAVLLAHADEAELSDPAYRAELRRWVHAGSEADAEAVLEGIPANALFGDALGGRGSTLRLRDFSPGPGQAAGEGGPPPAEHPFVAILGTESDDPASWLQAGQALSRLLLTATVAGVGASPLSQVLDLPAYRQSLTSSLGLLGHPQMVLRLGYGPAHATTSRRAVDEVLTFRES